MTLYEFQHGFFVPKVPVICERSIYHPSPTGVFKPKTMHFTVNPEGHIVEMEPGFEKTFGEINDAIASQFTISSIHEVNSDCIRVLLAQEDPDLIKPMTLKQFLKKWIAPNTLIRLWVNIRDAEGHWCHKMLSSRYDWYYPSDFNFDQAPSAFINPELMIPVKKVNGSVDREVGMSWEAYSLENASSFITLYKDFYVEYVTDIVCEHDREAVNIVITDKPYSPEGDEILAINELLNSDLPATATHNPRWDRRDAPHE